MRIKNANTSLWGGCKFKRPLVDLFLISKIDLVLLNKEPAAKIKIQ